MPVSQIRTDSFNEINTYTYTYVIFQFHKFYSQLHGTIQLNNWITWTKYIKSKQTLHDMRANKTNVKHHSD